MLSPADRNAKEHNSSSNKYDDVLMKSSIIFLLPFSSGVVAESASRLAARGLRLLTVVTDRGENGATVRIRVAGD